LWQYLLIATKLLSLVVVAISGVTIGLGNDFFSDVAIHIISCNDLHHGNSMFGVAKNTPKVKKNENIASVLLLARFNL
jgi:hypothetical protein